MYSENAYRLSGVKLPKMRSGITLVEMLIVIIIIAIVASRLSLIPRIIEEIATQ